MIDIGKRNGVMIHYYDAGDARMRISCLRSKTIAARYAMDGGSKTIAVL